MGVLEFSSIIESVRRHISLAKRKKSQAVPLFGDQPEFAEGEYRFTDSLRNLLFMCRIISDAVQLEPNSCNLYAGFQRLGYFLEHKERYKKLSACAKEVYIIGVADVELSPWASNVHIVTRKANLIERYWFEIAYGRNINTSLLAEELPEQEAGSRYRGFYTTSRAMTEKLLKKLSELGIIGERELFE